MRELYRTYPDLSGGLDDWESQTGRLLVKSVGPFQFIPLIARAACLACKLDILLLERKEPGGIVHRGGDIDNRLKTLFDALRMPQHDQEVEGEQPERGECPFLCPLEDDDLILGFGVHTDRLLMPPPSGRDTDVRVLIEVTVKLTAMTYANLALVGD